MDERNPLVRLQDLQHFLAAGTLDESLKQQAAMTATLVGAASCSIMLLNSGEGEAMRMSVYARHGNLPDEALEASVGRGEGIAGRVLATGKALLVADISKSQFALLARGRAGAGASLVCAPIRIDGKIVGVINAAGASGQPAFRETELRLLEVTALFIGKSIQVQQLQRLLDSRFAQLALEREEEGQVRTSYHKPEDVARVLARSFFKELTKAGFAPAQIISATTEIIDQLNNQLKKDK
jgi:L-methionine (R)-S-oxide reductase